MTKDFAIFGGERGSKRWGKLLSDASGCEVVNLQSKNKYAVLLLKLEETFQGKRCVSVGEIRNVGLLPAGFDSISVTSIWSNQ